MKKKLTAIGLLFVLAFAFAACNTESGLAEYLNKAQQHTAKRVLKA